MICIVPFGRRSRHNNYSHGLARGVLIAKQSNSYIDGKFLLA